MESRPPANDRKRVKVYELKNNDWFDRGTGFCKGVVQNVSTCAALIAPLRPDPFALRAQIQSRWASVLTILF
jgi:hypothetical protein